MHVIHEFIVCIFENVCFTKFKQNKSPGQYFSRIKSATLVVNIFIFRANCQPFDFNMGLFTLLCILFMSYFVPAYLHIQDPFVILLLRKAYSLPLRAWMNPEFTSWIIRFFHCLC